MSYLFEVRHLTKTYKNGTIALKDVSFCLEKGKVLGLIGPNGSGKTTLLSVISGLLHYDQGSIRFENQPIDGSPLKKAIGFLPEETHFYEDLTAYENLTFYAKLFLVPPAEIAPRIRLLAEQVDLAGNLSQPVGSYSAGMKKRLSMMWTLLHNPRVILLDEPTNALDVENREEVLKIVKQCKQSGRTVVLSSHNLSEIEEICDQFLMLRQTVKFFGDRAVIHAGEKDICVKFQLYRPLDRVTEIEQSLLQLPGVSQVLCEKQEIHLVVDQIENVLIVREHLAKHNVQVLFVFPVESMLKRLYFTAMGGEMNAGKNAFLSGND